MRLAVLASHPVQYYAPLLRTLAERIDLTVFYAHKPTAVEQGADGFGAAFQWDVDLLSGYESVFLKNVAKHPNVSRFSGCDTPEIGQRLRAGRFDAVLALGWHLKSMIQGIVAAKRLGLPVMVRGDSQLVPHSPLKTAIKAFLYPQLLRVFDAALVVGQRNNAYYTHYRMPKTRLFPSPHCVDNDRFAQGATAQAGAAVRAAHAIAPEESVVLFVGRLVAFKRVHDLVEAVANLSKQRPVRLVIAGSGPLESAIVDHGKAHGRSPIMLGFQNQSQLPGVYACANVLALPSTGQETWGLVANEALASGVPVVVSEAAGCAPDLSVDGRVCRTHPLGDIAALAHALEATLAHPPCAAAIKAAADRHALVAAADGIVSACETALQQRRSAARPVSDQVGST